jgi:hypothetical protein
MGEPALVAAYWGGLSLPAVLLVLTVLAANVVASALKLPSVGWLGFSGVGSVSAVVFVALTMAAGYGLWRFQDRVREQSGALAGFSLSSLARLDWLYRLVWGLIRGLGNTIDNLAGVLEGEGAMLWTLVAGVLVYLLLRQ